MTGFEVLPARLDGLSGQVGDVAGELRAELAAVQAQIEDVLAGSWRGPASRAFASGWDEWLAGARDVLGALETIGELLQSSAATYRSAEAASVMTR